MFCFYEVMPGYGYLFRLDYFIFLKNIRKMKPPRKPEEEENDSGSDTESEDEEDEDTVF